MNSIDNLPGIDKATVIPAGQHGISRRDFSEASLLVVKGLQRAGFAAFLVGGCLRDLLLGLKPKDFDVATDARPEEVRRIFRRSRIIGRRFKIVHVHFGREIIEVTTFRGHHEANNRLTRAPTREQSRKLDSAHSHSGMTLIDNVYGNIDEDAVRRDFTVNALYCSVNDFRLYDFHGGIDDLRERRLRILGDASERFREDPVRILRAIRFAAKLGFRLDEATETPLKELSHLLQAASSPRLFDELVKLSCGGHAVATFRMLREFGIDQALFSCPPVAEDEARDPPDRLVALALRNSDDRIARDLGVTPGFLLAALLWPTLRRKLDPVEGEPNLAHLLECAEQVFLDQLQYTAIPRRISYYSKEIWELQHRLQRKERRSAKYCFNHPRFRAAYDFLLLREQSGEDCDGMGQWWTDFQEVDEERRNLMIEQLRPRRRKRRRRRRKTGADKS